MDDTLLFIPPCCVNKMLPKAMKEAPRRMLSFYTHGDVTAEKFYRAISYEMISRHVLVRSNRTFMELKFLAVALLSRRVGVLIVPLWN